jgi:hypothetical protein
VQSVESQSTFRRSPPFKSESIWQAVLGLPPDLTLVSYLAYSSTLKMEATYSFETSVDIQQIARHYIPVDRILYRKKYLQISFYLTENILPLH